MFVSSCFLVKNWGCLGVLDGCTISWTKSRPACQLDSHLRLSNPEKVEKNTKFQQFLQLQLTSEPFSSHFSALFFSSFLGSPHRSAFSVPRRRCCYDDIAPRRCGAGRRSRHRPETAGRPGDWTTEAPKKNVGWWDLSCLSWSSCDGFTEIPVG